MHKSQNVSILLYHFVCHAKYRKVVFDKGGDETLKEVCLEIETRYEVHFLGIGADKNHVHILIQSVPSKSPTQIIKILKSMRATNSSGFTALPGGFRTTNGSYQKKGEFGVCWSATEENGSPYTAWERYLVFDNNYAFGGIDLKNLAFSVLCIKN